MRWPNFFITSLCWMYNIFILKMVFSEEQLLMLRLGLSVFFAVWLPPSNSAMYWLSSLLSSTSCSFLYSSLVLLLYSHYNSSAWEINFLSLCISENAECVHPWLSYYLYYSDFGFSFFPCFPSLIVKTDNITTFPS